MRSKAAILLILVMTPFLAGCPASYRYTSADLQARNPLEALFALFGSPLALAPDAEGGTAAPREVIEPDVIRRVGNLLYVLNQYRGLIIVDLDSKAILGQAPTYGFPRDLYVEGGRAYVLVSGAYDYSTDGNTVRYSLGSRLYVLDISASTSPRILSSFALQGDLVDSRLVGQALYAVTSAQQWVWVEGVATGVAVKQQTEEGSWVTSVNVADPNNIFEADQAQFPGASTVIQATSQAIFVASPRWEGASGMTTTIQYVDISDPQGALRIRGSARVPGEVADRFKMDSYNGVLRVVSSGWEDTRRVYLNTIDLSNPDALTSLGQLDFERAHGETLFATRFDGPRAYVVTYLIKDPLFVVDVSDPRQPRVAGLLEAPGWSTHIEPRGGYLLALGVDDTAGQRVSVSLFNVTNPAAPTFVDRVTFGNDWTWSSAYEDVKAFSVFDDLLIVPFSGWTADVGGYERLQFVSWWPEGLEKRGFVDLEGKITRSFAYAGDYYGLTAEQLATINATDLNAPQVTHRLTLAENVSDFVPLSGSLGAEILTRFDTGVTTVRTHALPVKALGEARVNVGSLLNAFPYGNSVVLVGTAWPAGGEFDVYMGGERYVVARVDCSDPAHPTVIGPVSVEVRPYFGYWTYPVPLFAEVSDQRLKLMPVPWYPQLQPDSAFVLGDLLVLRCTANGYDAVVGGAAPSQGLAVVELGSLNWTSTIGLGFETIHLVQQAGDKLAVGTSVPANPIPITGQATVAHFLTLVDVHTASAGPSVNVPGLFVQYDPSTDLLTLHDYQWGPDASLVSALQTARWDGLGEVQVLFAQALPTGAGQVLGRGDRVYIDSYNGGYSLQAASIDPAGRISLSGSVLVTDQWGSLIDAKGSAAYVSVGGGAVARYSFAGAPVLTHLVEVMGIPSVIRFGNSQAYAALGYFGVVTLPL